MVVRVDLLEGVLLMGLVLMSLGIVGVLGDFEIFWEKCCLVIGGILVLMFFWVDFCIG